MPRAESPVHREASATSALPPCTALPAVAASALPACGARLRTAGADGASRGAGADLSWGTLPAAGSQAQPLARLRSGASPRAPPKLPRQPAHALPPRRGKTCSRSLRAAGTGRRAACLPPPPRPGSPARGSLAEAPALHRRAAPRHAVPCRAVRGARRCPPAPPSPSPAGGMSAGEAKEYLARREIPQLFEVGEAERGGGAGWRGAFSPRRGGAPRWDPRGGQRAEGGWKDGAARGCGAPALRGEPRRGGAGPRPAPRRAGGRCRPMAAPRGPGWGLPAAEPAGERLPAARLPAGSAGGRAAAPALLQPPGEGANLGARRAKDPRGRAAEEFRRGVSFGFSPGFRRSGRRTKPTTAQ